MQISKETKKEFISDLENSQIAKRRFKDFMENKTSDKKLKRIEECNKFLQLKESLNKVIKVHRANSCKDRFCPICSKKKALKNVHDIFPIIKWIFKKCDKRFIFVTLSSPNVKKEKLEETIKLYNAAFHRLQRFPEFKNIKGYLRKLEITYNKERDDYNPHFHVIFAVNKTYFTDSRQYISHERWLEMWQKATRLYDEIKIIDVRKIKSLNDDDLLKGVLEVAKYSAKSEDYLQDKNTFNAFYSSLRSKQLIVFGGLFKEGRKKLKEKNDDEFNQFLEVDDEVYYYLYFEKFMNKSEKYKEKVMNFKTLKEAKELFFELNNREPNLPERKILKSLLEKKAEK